MGESLDSGLWLNYVLSLLFKKITVPTDFQGQCEAVAEILRDDVSGLVDSLTDFAIDTASVKFSIESPNEEYSRILNKWLETINIEYRGRIPVGINALAREYYKERWKGSSFPILKIVDWTTYDGNILLPNKMFFVDGSDIRAKEKDEKSKVRHLINYDYYIGNTSEEKYKLEGDNIIFNRPYGRWFDKYPTPYLIKRGIYHNWKILYSLKNKQSELLDQIIPYLLLIKKGSPDLIRENIKAGYSTEELEAVIQDLQNLRDKMESTNLTDKTIKSPIRATNFDEDISHLIPDISNFFNRDLFAVAERNILSALGFIDVVEATSTSRRESILNPKAFIEETKSGVDGFKEILQQLMYRIQEENSDHKKYMNVEYYITNSSVRGFMTDEFKRQVKRLFDAGKISAQTSVELIAETDFETEVMRREKEAKKGIEYIMYPQLTQNVEDKGIDLVEEEPKKTDVNNEEIPEDKVNPNEKQEYDIGEKEEDLEIAPYKNIKDLPARVKKNLSSGLQSVFMRVFNRAYETYKNDTKAFRIAWSVIKKLAKKNKNGQWIKKSSRAKVTKAMIEEVLSQEETDVLENAMKEKEIEVKLKQEELLNKLLKKHKE